MLVAMIPARGGSKRLPRKNVRLFGGQPLLVHSIRAAAEVPRIARCIVSTDDDEIASVAARHGAEVVMRPAALASDFATTASVALHLLEHLAVRGEHPRGVVTLQPNCPLRPASIVEQAIDLFLAREPDSVVSVTESHHKIGTFRAGYFAPEYRPGTRSQDLGARYFENGVVYVSNSRLLLETGDMFGSRMVPLVTDPLYALGDIDTELDFQVAEFLFQTYRERFEKAAPTPETPR